MISFLKKGGLFLTILAVMLSCSKDESQINQMSIEEYIEANNLNAVDAGNGLFYVIEEEGEGDNPTDGQTVTVHYTGSFFDGQVFDSSTGKSPFSFVVGSRQVIQGWDIGIPLFKKGGSGILLIPYQMAYGSNGYGPIPPYEPLRFDIEIVDIE